MPTINERIKKLEQISHSGNIMRVFYADGTNHLIKGDAVVRVLLDILGEPETTDEITPQSLVWIEAVQGCKGMGVLDELAKYFLEKRNNLIC